MNKEELIKEYDEKAKVLRDEFISMLKGDEKEFKLTYPEYKDVVFYINDNEGKIREWYFNPNDINDKYMFEHGLYFGTEEEAEQFLKERKLLFKLHQWAKEKNEGWQPDWSNDDEEKYFITYIDCESIELSWKITWGTMNFTKLPYFKTSEITQECIKLFGDEIKEVLC